MNIYHVSPSDGAILCYVLRLKIYRVTSFRDHRRLPLRKTLESANFKLFIEKLNRKNEKKKFGYFFVDNLVTYLNRHMGINNRYVSIRSIYYTRSRRCDTSTPRYSITFLSDIFDFRRHLYLTIFKGIGRS